MTRATPTKRWKTELRRAADRFDLVSPDVSIDLDRCLQLLHELDDRGYRSARIVELRNGFPPAYHRAFEADVTGLSMLRRRTGRSTFGSSGFEDVAYIAAYATGEFHVLDRRIGGQDGWKLDAVAQRLASSLELPLWRSRRAEPIVADWSTIERKFRRLECLAVMWFVLNTLSALPVLLVVGLPLLLTRQWTRSAAVLAANKSLKRWDKVDQLTRASVQVRSATTIIAVICAGVTVLATILVVLFVATIDGLNVLHAAIFWALVGPFPALMTLQAITVARLAGGWVPSPVPADRYRRRESSPGEHAHSDPDVG